MLDVRYRVKEIARSVLAPLLYRYPPFTLAPERLYLFLHTLIECRGVPGPIVEIGCNLGGTAAIAKKMMRRLGIEKPYLCYDTFDGFIEEQFRNDVQLGTPAGDRHLFSGNSRRLVAKILKQHGVGEVELIQGDIMTLPDRALPAPCSVVLADVDLTEPTYATLARLWHRLAPGGTMLVDDCADHSSWRAKVAYQRFCAERGIAEQYQHGMGLIIARGAGASAVTAGDASSARCSESTDAAQDARRGANFTSPA